MTDFRQTNRAVDKGIAADDQATHRIEVQLVNAAFSGGNQLIIRFKPGRAARKLTIFVAECGDICIVITRFVGNHDIAHFQRRRQTARRTRINDNVRLAALKQQGRAQCRCNFTDA